MDHDVKFDLPPDTMLIKATNPDEQGPCVLINKCDFDPKTQEEYIPPRRKAGDDKDSDKKEDGNPSTGKSSKSKK